MAGEPKNLEVLTEFRIKGVPQKKGAIIPKAAFGPDGHRDWQNLAHMKPARVAETDDAVRDAPVAKADETVPKSATKPAMPNATK